MMTPDPEAPPPRVSFAKRLGDLCRLDARFSIPLLIATAVAVAIGTIAQFRSQPGHREAAVPHPAKVELTVLEFLSAGNQAKAEELLEAEIGRFPEALQGVKLLIAGNDQKSQDFLNKHLNEIRNAGRSFFLFAACARSRFDWKASFQFFRLVNAIDPLTPRGQCSLRVVQLDSDQLKLGPPAQVDQVFVEFNKLVDANPDDVMIRWMLAVQCRNWNRNAEGVEHYKRILEKWNPAPSLVHQTYANLLDELQQYEEALVERRQVVKMEPAAWSYDGLGNTLAHLRRFKEANGAHAIAVQMAPDSVLYWSNWAVCLTDEGEFDDAVEKCRRAAEFDDPEENWRPWWIWGRSLERQGKLEEALEKYKTSLAAYPNYPFLQDLVADLEAKVAK